MKKELTVEAGKTYWGVHWKRRLKKCRVLELLPDNNCRIRVRDPDGPVRTFIISTSVLRDPSTFRYASEKAARKALVRALEKDADKTFTAWNKLTNRLHKERENLKALS